MAYTVLTLLTTPGRWRLGLWDNRRQEVVAVSREARQLVVGDRWVVADDVDHDLVTITAGAVDLTADDQFAWTLVLADAVRFG